MVGWYHQLNGHESEQTLGDSKGQGSLACCSPCGHKESTQLREFHFHKITTDGDCSHEIERHLLLGRKTMTNLDSILKGRDITFPQRSA